MGEDDLRFMAETFRPFAKELKISSWYREPDFSDNYRQLWNLENALSTKKTKPHDELMSIWRAARDPGYVPWLAQLGLKKCQLSLFGGEALTDKYTGRRGAYQDILRSIELLKKNGIAPRLQAFVNQETIGEMSHIDELISFYNIEYAFAHQGTCVPKLYDLWPTLATLEQMPPKLTAYSLKHWNVKSLNEIFGKPEAKLYQKFCDSNDTKSFVTDKPVFFIDRNWDVHPNISAPEAHWRMGNLRHDNAQAVIERYLNNSSPAQAVRHNKPLSEIVHACGNPDGQGLFGQSDYIEYMLDRFCERES